MKLLLILYFIGSGITWVSGEAGQGISGRIAIADIVMLAMMGLMFFTRPHWIRVSKLGRAAIVMVLSFSLGIINSQAVQSSIVEWLVHMFSVAGFIVIYSVIVRQPTEERLAIATWWIRAASLVAVIGIADFIGPLIGVPSPLTLVGAAPNVRGGLVSTFRNTGQAGTFFAVACVTAIPLQRAAGHKSRRMELGIHTLILVLSVLLTVKRAAILGLAVGFALLILTDRGLRERIRSSVKIVLALLIAVSAAFWVHDTSAGFQSRFQRKLAPEAAANVEEFAAENIVAAAKAFADHPISGVGLGGVAGVYTPKYEIHSTYLSVPASTGIVGTLGYLLFLVVLFQSVKNPRTGDPKMQVFGRVFRPLLIGLLVSFGYTYHIRKREFWITAAVASSLMAPMPQPRRGTRTGQAFQQPQLKS